MDVGKPYEGLFPGVDSSVLKVLSSSSQPRSVREIARAAGRSHTGVGRVLARFEAHGLVNGMRAGGSIAYALNSDHVAASAITKLANLRTELFERMKNMVREWEIEPVHVSVFGSTARGDGDENSDIDVLVVRTQSVDPGDDAWRTQLNDFSMAILAWTGNYASVAEVTESDLADATSRSERVLNEIKTDAIDLQGISARELLRAYTGRERTPEFGT